jgi:hypothetical protein
MGEVVPKTWLHGWDRPPTGHEGTVNGAATNRRVAMTPRVTAKAAWDPVSPELTSRWFGRRKGDVKQRLQSRVRQRCIRSGNECVVQKSGSWGYFFWRGLTPAGQLCRHPSWPVLLPGLHSPPEKGKGDLGCYALTHKKGKRAWDWLKKRIKAYQHLLGEKSAESSTWWEGGWAGLESLALV